MFYNKHSGIHVFVFCCVEYKHLVSYCIDSIKQNVIDPILSITVVSNAAVEVKGTKNILDHDYWKLIDPDKKYTGLYNDSWTKQQILKLSVDQLVSGNCLIVDAEVIFLRNMQWIQNGKVNMFTSNSRHFQPYFDLMDDLLGLPKCDKNSFICDTMMFSTGILEKIKTDIETRTGNDWLQAIQDLITIPDNKFRLSEFELYGNYLIKYHQDQINAHTHMKKHVVIINSRQSNTLEDLMILLREQTPEAFISVNINTHSYNSPDTPWLTFYSQIKDSTWPDCDREEDFYKLPKHVQDECIDVFGYKAPIRK